MSRRFWLVAAVLLAVSSVLAHASTIPDRGYAGAAELADGLQTSDLASGVTPEQLAQLLVGRGVRISRMTYSGARVAAGIFSGDSGIIGFGTGVVLSTGNIRNVVGPNRDDSITQENGTPGDPDLSRVAQGAVTLDAAVLELDFVPRGSTVSFQFVFASDEYNESVYARTSDVLAVFLNGRNIAVVPGTDTPVSINTINGGNPLGREPRNPQLYRNNDRTDRGGAINTEMDGLTVVLTAEGQVRPRTVNRLRLAIADAVDREVDSNLFLKAGSLVSVDEEEEEDDDDERGARERERRRARQAQRESDDLQLEGTVVETRCDDKVPTLLLATGDGIRTVRLLEGTGATCPTIRPGDYVELVGRPSDRDVDAESITIRPAAAATPHPGALSDVLRQALGAILPGTADNQASSATPPADAQGPSPDEVPTESPPPGPTTAAAQNAPLTDGLLRSLETFLSRRSTPTDQAAGCASPSSGSDASDRAACTESPR